MWIAYDIAMDNAARYLVLDEVTTDPSGSTEALVMGVIDEFERGSLLLQRYENGSPAVTRVVLAGRHVASVEFVVHGGHPAQLQSGHYRRVKG